MWSSEDQEQLIDSIRWFPHARWRCRTLRLVPISFKDGGHELEFCKLQAERRRNLVKPFVCLVSPMMILMAGAMFSLSANASDLSAVHKLASGIYTLLAALMILLLLRIYSDGFFMLISNLILILLVATQTHRQAMILGEDLNETEERGGCGGAGLTDSFTLLMVAGFMSFVCSMPGVRCTRCIWMCIGIPSVYWMWTVYLPGNFEGDVRRRMNLSSTFAIVCLYFFLGRVRLEKMERTDFYCKKLLSSSLTQEKVLRARAEHEAASGPFSSKSRSPDNSRPPDNTIISKPDIDAASTNLSSAVFYASAPEVSVNRFQALKELGEMEAWAIPDEHLSLNPDEILGGGGYGRVYRGTYFGSSVAIKVAVSTDPRERFNTIASELRHFRNLAHPNIITFYGACIVPGVSDVILVMEYLPEARDLASFLDSVPSIQENIQHCILLGVCSALNYLHLNLELVHGDLKPSNVVVIHGVAKLIDFGLSRVVKPGSRPMGGTVGWMAPEVLTNAGLEPSPTADLFSFGRLTFYVITGLMPVQDFTSEKLLELAIDGKVPALNWPETTQDSLQAACSSFCDQCMSVRREDRPVASSVMQLLNSWPTPPTPCAQIRDQLKEIRDGSQPKVKILPTVYFTL